jgi:topoisomerase IV subunit B
MAYDSSQIEVLDGLEPVRKRPGMYTDITRPNHLVQEVVDNSVDEAMAGHATTIDITLYKDGSCKVEDDGRGMPVDQHPTEKRPGAEVILDTLHAGGKFSNKSYGFSGGLHGVGVSVVNALSTDLFLTIRRNGKVYQAHYQDGNVVRGLKPIKGEKVNKDDTGTCIHFTPDPKYFDHPNVHIDKLCELLKGKAILCPGLRINVTIEERDQTVSYHYEEGLTAFLKEQPSFEESVAQLLSDGHVVREDEPMEFTWACYWHETDGQAVERAYTNLIPTTQGGTHVNAFKQGVFEGVKEYAELHGAVPRTVTITSADVWKNINYVVSLKMQDPIFAGQTKERLASRNCANFVSSRIKDSLSLLLSQHTDKAQALITLVISNAQARMKQAKKVERKALDKVLPLPGKLTDCHTQNREDAEIFVVEGDSAGGSARQARDKETQAIMPLRGKILNTWDMDSGVIFNSEEIKNIGSAIGVDPNSEDLSELRYGKICVLADADSDGLHIATLFVALFVRHFPAIVEAGNLYVAMPPLYRIDVAKEIHYALDESEKAQIIADIEHRKVRGEINVQRFKGLGEMNPDQLKETALSPVTRRLVQVTLGPREEYLQCFNTLLGKKKAHTDARKVWLSESGNHAIELI